MVRLMVLMRKLMYGRIGVSGWRRMMVVEHCWLGRRAMCTDGGEESFERSVVERRRLGDVLRVGLANEGWDVVILMIERKVVLRLVIVLIWERMRSMGGCGGWIERGVVAKGRLWICGAVADRVDLLEEARRMRIVGWWTGLGL
jgi:hypothetical protein